MVRWGRIKVYVFQTFCWLKIQTKFENATISAYKTYLLSLQFKVQQPAYTNLKKLNKQMIT